jgi:dipeptidyl aminopeptidase/acylaminoacyl peptidase
MMAFTCGILLSVAAAIAQAPTPPPQAQRLTSEIFATLPSLESPRLSPDGNRYAAKVAIGDRQLFAIVPVAGGKPTLVDLGEHDLNWWRWVNNEWLVVGVGREQSFEGDSWYLTRALGVHAATGRASQLAGRLAGQNADDVLWTARDGSARVLLAYQTSIYPSESGFWPQVEEIDLTTGKRRVVERGKEGVFDWYADGAGVVRMGIGMSEDGRRRRLIYRSGPGEGFRTIERTRTPGETLTVPALFLPERDKALTISDDANGFSALYELDLKTMERGRQLFASPGYDIAGLVQDATGSGYLGVSVEEERAETRWTNPDMVAIQAEISALVRGARASIMSLDAARSRAIVHVGGADAPGAWFLFQRAQKRMDWLADINPAVGLRRLHPVRTIRYAARDGLEVAAVLTLPRGRTGKLPLIVMPHGGPFARDSEQWDWWPQFLADRGYAVVQPNYRGSSGYGTPFTKKGEGQWGLAMQDDLDDVVKALAVRGIADPARVCMVGASYGGYAAMRAAQRGGGVYRCAVSYAGVSDLNRMLRYQSNFLFSGARRDWLRRQAPDLNGVSPLNFPGQFSIPILVMHGEKDRVVPIVQSRVLAQKLKAAGKDVTYIVQPQGDHHFSRSADRLEFLKALEAFLAKHNPA